MLQPLDNKNGLRPNVGKILSAPIQAVAILLLAGVLAMVVNLWRPLSVPFHYEGAQKQDVDAILGKSVWIAVQEAEPLFAHKKAVFIDARPPGLYEQERISGALNLPVDSFEPFFERVRKEIPPETMIIVYCDGKASERSGALAGKLLQRGYRKVRVLEKGWDLWVAQELPIEAGRRQDSAEAKRGTS